ncbi:spore germination protein [Paenibacillus periandrae]|uniref:spore germination protein n=1 Tax=Paenibacillus periandrae TaxID=1761741 RepID=UPI001F091F6E|nr:spore germination protein [Paenibacillus periandrae]
MSLSCEKTTQLQINQIFERSYDFICAETVLNNTIVHICYLQTLVSFKETLDLLVNQLSDAEEGMDPIRYMALSYNARVNLPLEELVQSVLRGMLIVFKQDETENVVFEPLHPSIARSVGEAQNENPIQTSMDAFTEDMKLNVGLMRRKVMSKDLIIQSHSLGSDYPRELSVLYLQDQADPKMVKLIQDCLNENRMMDISDIQHLLKVLKQPRFSLVPTYVTSELPVTTKHYLQDGRVVILLDHFPFAISFPAIVTDFWAVKTDQDHPVPFMILYRIIRVISLLVAISMPGLYVVLNAVNPELLRIQLAVSITDSREGVPYPVLVEVLLMLIIIEMVIEASIRLPKSIGPTITMVGGIILGEAVVQARLMSNFLIIIVAATTIAHFSLGTYMNSLSIRLYKYVVIFFSALYGILGLMSSLVLLCFYLGSITTFSVPYLSYTAKRGKSDE